MQYRSEDQFVPLFENFCRKNQIDGKEIIAHIEGFPLKLKVAAKDETRAKGFMHSREPGDDEGILFVYDSEEPLVFWMKSVDFPLDILFFDSNLNLIDHQTMEPGTDLNDDDLPKYSSKKPCRFAVELKSGWCEKNLKNKNCRLKF
jgi:uncharacterized membrane protein (UPF0127 family)